MKTKITIDRKKQAGRILAGILMFALILFFAGGCDNPINILDEVETAFKRDNNMFLVVEDFAPTPNALGVNPGGELYIVFDRAIRENSISSAAIEITPLGEDPVDWTFRYNPSTNTLYLRGDPYFINSKEYTIRIIGVIAQDGSAMEEELAWTFTTGVAPAGSITKIRSNGSRIGASNDSSQDGYTDVLDLEIDVDANPQAGFFLISDDADYMSDSGDFASSPDWQSITPDSTETISVDSSFFDVDNREDGQKTIYIRFRHPTDGTHSERSSASIIYDKTPPSVNLPHSRLVRNAEVDYGGDASDSSGIVRYEWTGNGVLFNGNPTGSSSGVTLSGLSDELLDNGTFTVVFKAVDNAGNWADDSMTFVWDTIPPTIDGITIDSGATYSTDTSLHVLAWGFTDNISSDSQMSIGISDTAFDFTATWYSLSADNFTIYLTTTGGNGVTRFANAWIRDEAGNYEKNAITDSILVDDVHPSPPVSVIPPVAMMILMCGGAGAAEAEVMAISSGPEAAPAIPVTAEPQHLELMHLPRIQSAGDKVTVCRFENGILPATGRHGPVPM
jgi:hypothetical protein